MKKAFVVQWRHPIMAAPAFWYYTTREDAEVVAADLRQDSEVEPVREVEVADRAHLLYRGATRRRTT
jgi:hypothetical protein